MGAWSFPGFGAPAPCIRQVWGFAQVDEKARRDQPFPSWPAVGAAEFVLGSRNWLCSLPVCGGRVGVGGVDRASLRLQLSQVPGTMGRQQEKGGGGDASRFPEKEPSSDCHLRMTESAPPHFPFFPLFLQLWVLKSVLYAQMLGFALRFLTALWWRSAPGCPTCGRAPGANKSWGGRLWEGRFLEPHAESRNPEDSRDLLAGINLQVK